MALHKGAWTFLLVDHGAVWNLHDYNSESLAWTNSASLFMSQRQVVCSVYHEDRFGDKFKDPSVYR